MIKKLAALLAAIITCSAAFAQNVHVSIIVKNEKNEPVQNVTAKVYGREDSVLQQKVLSAGVFFLLPANRGYTLQLSATNINPVSKILMLAGNDTSVTVMAQTAAKSLDAVVLTSRKSLVKEEDDKTIVDAEALANSSTNAYEVLEKTPGAVVDQDGNVYLNSATPAQIQINGKEVKLSAADIASLLKSLPANSVVKIEILRSPSAKYDAASSGGIINIVLKKGIKLGTSGSANVGYFQGRYRTETAGFNLNRSQGKASTHVSYQFTNRNNFEELNSHRFVNGVDISQKAYTKYPSLNNYVAAGMDYELNKKLTLGYDLRFSANHNNSRAANNIDIIKESNQALLGQNNSVVTNKGNTYYLGNNINVKYKIDSLGSEWTTSLDYNYFDTKNDQVYNNQFPFPARPYITGDGKINNAKNIFATQTDLLLKTKNKFTIEAGAKFNFSNSNNFADYFIDSSTGRKQDNFQTNKFRYKEEIASAYLQVAKTFYGFTLKPGLRVENTNINGRQSIPKDTTLRIQRTDLFPYVYLRHNIMKIFGFLLTGNAIYRRSITRPYYEALNPYPKYIDQFLYDVGNPRLQPQFTTNYEFNINADQFPVFSIGLNDIKDIFTNVTYQDSTTKIAYRTYDNLGRNKEMYLRFVGGIPPGKKYFFYAGGQYNHVDYTGFYQNAALNYKRGSWTFFMYHNYKPTATFNISINAFMRLHGLQNFYELKPFGQINITANQAILKKKLNIILSANDILRTNKYSFSLQQAGIRATGSRVNDTRRIGLTLRYNFGIKPKEEKQQMFEAPKEQASN